MNRRLYADVDPTASPDFVTKTGLLAEIDAWCRARDPRVVQVSVSLAGSRTAVEIVRLGRGERAPRRGRWCGSTSPSRWRRMDAARPARLALAGAKDYDEWIQPDRWKALADARAAQGRDQSRGRPCPAGRDGSGARAGLDRRAAARSRRARA